MSVKLAAGSSARKAVLPRPAKDPWQISPDDFPVGGTHEEELWFIASYAVLAPSTHNTQPWQFGIGGKHIDLWADLARGLPVIDPQGRELTISCGAALFYIRLVMSYFGHSPAVELLPNSEQPEWLARVQQGAESEVDTDGILLFQAITERRTNRHRFREEPVPTDLLSEFESAAQAEGVWLRVIEGDEARAAEGDRQQWADKEFRKELAAWIRPAGSPSRDGLPVATQDLGSLMAHAGPLVIRTFDLGKGHAAKDREIALHSPALVVLGSDRDDASAWLAAGQALARILLRAQGDNVSASFLNQPIETSELRPRLAEITGQEGFPQLLLRLGYGDPVPHTPRRKVAEVVSVLAAN
jgi:hypothetical protein